MVEHLLESYVPVRNRLEDESAQTLVEYALVAALMVIVVAAAFALTDVDTKVSSTLSVLASKF